MFITILFWIAAIFCGGMAALVIGTIAWMEFFPGDKNEYC